MNRTIKLLGILLIFVISCLLIYLTNINYLISRNINIIPPVIYMFLLLLTIYYWLLSLNNNHDYNYFIIIYIIFLLINLFFRYPYDTRIINTKLYLFDWLKIITKDKIVFINIIGNILLFIPMGYLFKTLKINLLYSIILILFIEIIQYFTKLGIFDFTDILLNIFGIILGILIKRKEHYGRKQR